MMMRDNLLFFLLLITVNIAIQGTEHVPDTQNIDTNCCIRPFPLTIWQYHIIPAFLESIFFSQTTEPITTNPLDKTDSNSQPINPIGTLRQVCKNFAYVSAASIDVPNLTTLTLMADSQTQHKILRYALCMKIKYLIDIFLKEKFHFLVFKDYVQQIFVGYITKTNKYHSVHEVLFPFLLQNTDTKKWINEYYKYQRDDFFLLSILSYNNYQGDSAIIHQLIQYGADINLKDEFYNTPVWYACRYNNTNVLKMLLNAGAIIQEDSARYVFHACKENKADILETLLLHGADPNKVYKTNPTPLITACLFTSLNSIKVLIHHGVNINHTDKNNRTPLWWACRKGNNDIAQVLLNHGADKAIMDSSGKYPLDVASNDEIIQLLKQYA